MSLNQVDIKQRPIRITTKLTFSYTLALVISSFLVFSVLYFGIEHTLEEQDSLFLRSQRNEISEHLSASDLEGFKDHLVDNGPSEINSQVVTKIIENDKVIFQHMPTMPFDVVGEEAALKQFHAQKGIFITRLPILGTEDYALVLMSEMQNGQILMLAKNMHGMAALKRNLRILFSWALLAVTIVSGVATLFLANHSMSAVKSLVQSVKLLEEEDSLSKRLNVEIQDPDLNELQKSFNVLLNKISGLVRDINEAFDHLAHDIRTPVTRLRGRAELALLGTGKVEDYREALQSCYENSDRILKFLENLTKIAEAENRSISIKYELKSLSEMIREMMDLYEIAFEEKNITVKQILVKNDKAYLDPNLIRRVIANLLDNAHKYTPEGGEVVIESYRTDKHVVLSVRDSGLGIPKEEQKLIWNRLYRGDKSRSEQGMGLGLTFVKAVVEAHGGVVNVISPISDGHGTEFLIKFKHQGSGNS